MLHNRAGRASHQLIRAQLMLFHTLSDEMHLTKDDQRLVLDLDERTWLTWAVFLSGGPLPAEPPLPEMLRRLSESVFGLAVMADRRGERRVSGAGTNADGLPGRYSLVPSLGNTKRP